MKFNDTVRIIQSQVILERGIDFCESDLEAEEVNSLGHRKFKKEFINKVLDEVGYDEVLKIGMCTSDQDFVNAVIIKYEGGD